MQNADQLKKRLPKSLHVINTNTMLSKISTLSQVSQDILADYKIRLLNPPSVIVCFQPVPDVLQVTNADKWLLSSRSLAECFSLSLELGIRGDYQTYIIDSFGVPLNQSLLSRSIDLVRIANDALNWENFQSSDLCPQVLHPFYGENVFLGGMVVTEADPSLIAETFAYKLALDSTLAMV